MRNVLFEYPLLCVHPTFKLSNGLPSLISGMDFLKLSAQSLVILACLPSIMPRGHCEPAIVSNRLLFCVWLCARLCWLRVFWRLLSFSLATSSFLPLPNFRHLAL